MERKKTIVDVFVDGTRKGWDIGVNYMLPNVLMAFIVIEVFKVLGLLDFIGRICTPVMALFGLPGESVMVLISAWLSMGGGVGTAASLYTNGTLTMTQVTILLPAIFLMGAQVQYMGRCLGTSGAKTKLYPMYFAISIFNAVISMLVMRCIS